MEVDEDSRDADEIQQLVQTLDKSRILDLSTYRALLAKDYSTSEGKRTHLDSVLKIFSKSKALPLETQQFVIGFLNDVNDNVRLYACDRITLLCCDKKNVEMVVTALAEIIAREYEESQMARKSMRKIIKDHMAEVFTLFPTVIEQTATVAGKLILLRFLDEEFKRLGSVGEKMKIIIQDIFAQLLAGTSTNSVEELEEILAVAAQTSFFTNRDEKRKLTDTICDTKALDLHKMYNDLVNDKISEEQLVQAYKTIVSISTWVDGTNQMAFYGLGEFLNVLEYIVEEKLFNKAISPLVLEKLNFLAQRRHGTANAFRFISPENAAKIDGEAFAIFFKVVQHYLDEVFCGYETNETQLDTFEKLLLIAYDLLPNPKEQGSFLKERLHWQSQAEKVFRNMKQSTELLKEELNEKDCPAREEKVILLRRRNNIGVLLKEFTAEKPRKSQYITPSWLRSWKPPRPVALTKPSERGRSKTKSPTPVGKQKQAKKPSRGQNEGVQKKIRKRAPTNRSQKKKND